MDKVERSAVVKRLLCTLCSLGTLGGYGCLIGGVGGYLFGRGRPLFALGGFIAGSMLAWAAIRLWQSYLKDIEILSQRERESCEDDIGNE